ncbi:MAG: TRAM domain-containing protein, partial [Bacilli bacterium]|nr:TRAM domain-containing protein [Bacilli bacterium]
MAQVEIKKLDSQQRGIGYIHDKIIFVPKTIPGEVCEVEIVKEKRNFQEGKLQKVLKA